MNIVNTIKGWVGLGPKVAPSEKIVTLPNGRRAVLDARGNFVRWVS